MLPSERFELGPDGPSRFPLGVRAPSRFPLGLAVPSSSLVTSMPSLGLFATACRWRGVLRYSDEQEEEDGKDDEEDDEEVEVDDGEGGEPGC